MAAQTNPNQAQIDFSHFLSYVLKSCTILSGSTFKSTIAQFSWYTEYLKKLVAMYKLLQAIPSGASPTRQSTHAGHAATGRHSRRLLVPAKSGGRQPRAQPLESNPYYSILFCSHSAPRAPFSMSRPIFNVYSSRAFD